MVPRTPTHKTKIKKLRANKHKTYLVLIRAPHRLHDILSLLLGDAAVLGDDGRQDGVDLARHV